MTRLHFSMSTNDIVLSGWKKSESAKGKNSETTTDNIKMETVENQKMLHG